MRVLAITPIFPNRLEPLYGPYNRQQFKALVDRGGTELRVLCAVPYVPGAALAGIPKRAAELSKLGDGDVIDNIETRYLRRLYVPSVGVPVAVPLYLTSLAPHHDLIRWADVILATWAYPDGGASVLLARAIGKPCAVKVHGSDVNVLAKMPLARAILKQILPRADAMITVSRAMGDELAKMGVSRERIHFVANGIDHALFSGHDRATARRELNLDESGPIVLFVGRIEPQKGIAELLEAFERVHAERPDATLVLVGDGVWRGRAEAARTRFAGRLVVAGARPFQEIPNWMAACDIVTLPSHNEGTPNVLLEGLATGRPAVATAVGGIPDVLADPRSGIVVPVKDARALADGLLSALARSWPEDEVRACGPISWDESAAALGKVLASIRRA
ncbi:MAG TPA: glycosyltransferase family 4 protein [Labilithrix sp.]|nr:glycosyltransferase family 4 protein [Labilithrix sp.]